MEAQIMIQIIGAIIAIAAFAILLETPKQYIWYAGLTGGIGGGSYLISMAIGTNEAIAYFVSALMVTVVSNIFARIFRTPVTVFLIAGILPTVPGAGIYQVAYHMIMGNQEQSLYYFMQTVKFAGAISLGIFVTETMFRLHKNLKNI